MVGVLALQGGFDPHLRTLKALGAAARPVTSLAEIEACQGLILPGGESTTIGKLLALRGLFDPLRTLVAGGLPVFGTCAGLILLSRRAVGRDQPLLDCLDVDVERNAYGRQTESFETSLDLTWGGETSALPAIFIRAPKIVRTGPAVEVLARFEGDPVCVRQGTILAASFHPELTGSTRLHAQFLSLL